MSTTTPTTESSNIQKILAKLIIGYISSCVNYIIQFIAPIVFVANQPVAMYFLFNGGLPRCR